MQCIHSRFTALTTQTNLCAHMQTKHLLMTAIGLEGIGGILFIFGSNLGAYLLVCIFVDICYLLYFFFTVYEECEVR